MIGTDGSSCLNGGVLDYFWGWCDCEDGYSGDRCEIGI